MGGQPARKRAADGGYPVVDKKRENQHDKAGSIYIMPGLPYDYSVEEALSMEPEMKILIADSDPGNRDTISELLSLYGYTVYTALNGDELFKEIDCNGPFDLIILDSEIRLSRGSEWGSDGSKESICRKIRERFSFCELPVLMLASGEGIDEITEGFEAGANDYVKKPIEKRELLARVNTLLTMKRSVSLALMNARSLEIEKQKRLFSDALHHLTTTLTSSLELGKILKSGIDALMKFIEVDRALVLLKEGDLFSIAFAVGYADGEMSVGACLNPSDFDILSRILERQSPLLIPDLEVDPWGLPCPEGNQEKRTHSLMGIPIIYNDTISGVLILESYNHDAYDTYQAEIAFNFAVQAGIAIENSRLFSETKRQAITDELTGIFNRRQIIRQIKEEFERSKATSSPLSILIFDIDHFKKINDVYGHNVGDDVLRIIARRCIKTIRESDFLGRIGGEEFIVILPGTTLDTAKTIAERLRRAVADDPITTCDGLQIAATVSVGIASLTDELADYEQLIKKADIALYRAKRSGRDRSAVCE